MTSHSAPNLLRIKAILRTNDRVAAALGLSREHVGRILAGRHPEPAGAAVVAHLIEHCPPHCWPLDWRQAPDD